MSDNKFIAVSGLIIGALAGGVPGAVIGGLIGSALQEITCPRCGNILKKIGNLWRCERCGYVKSN